MYLWNGMTNRRNSHGFTNIFDYARTNGKTADFARRWPTSEIRNGRHQIGSFLYLLNGMTYHRNSNGYPDVFDDVCINGDTADIAQRQPTSAIQNGGL
jgi:hypothetical protein